MINILHWTPKREDDYIDGECSTISELPYYVPDGSIWHVTETDEYYIKHPDGRWLDVTAATRIEVGK
jgi:hypothetical protein